MLPFLSLNGATAPGPGDELDLETSTAPHTMVIVVSGAGTATVELQGSHDGSSWVPLGPAVGSAAGANITAGNLMHVVRYVRANVVSISASTSVSATIASME